MLKLLPRYFIGLLTIVLIGMSHIVYAEKPNDEAALQGVKTGKVVWDVTVGTPSKLSLYLNVIAETYDDLKRQNVEPDMIFTFHGPVVRLLSSQALELSLDEEAALEQVREQIKDLHRRPGVRMEACSVAARMLDIDLESLMSEIKPVGNTFVSLIGYQQKGYALIPIE